ncbi:phage tail terminator protein, partial [Stenotrophomonas maltophilia]|uniref:phage tail terminator protein n=3 Tax=Lysobacteraceae TaxID=32033 RepID=UPI003D18D639
MSTQPFDTGLVRDRIRQGVSEKELRQVQGSADYAAVTALRDFPAPCCYVLLAR